MPVKIATSKHLRTSTELTLVAPIKAQFARTESNDSVSYATRLGALLKTFFELRRASIERTVDGSVGPLERLRTLYNFSWSVFDGGSKLLLAVNFDRPWEPYIRAIVDQAGPFLDAIFCHCEGYDENCTELGYVRFADWVRKNQIDVSLFYAAEPDLTVDDQRYLREIERMHREGAVTPRFDQRVARLAIGEPGLDGIPPGPAPLSRPEDVVALRELVDLRLGKASAAMVWLRQLFHVHDPNVKEQVDARRFFDRAAWLLLEPLTGNARDAIPRLPKELGNALLDMAQTADRESRKAGAGGVVPPPVALAVPTPVPLTGVQANIVSSYDRMTHGCMVLLGFDSGTAARKFLRRIESDIIWHDAVKGARVGVNLALTFDGFRTLGLTEVELEQFPIEFREGMAARAGSLGDVGEEHPDRWTEPLRGNLDGVQGGVLSLRDVDMVLIVQANEGICRELEWGKEHPLYAEVAALVGKPVEGDRADGVRSIAPDDGVRVLSIQPLQREFIPAQPGQPEKFVKERFGFADGVSQPEPVGVGEELVGDRVALGEVLLGHPGDRGESGGYPCEPKAYTLDGSFLVVRKLEQDVTALEEFIRENQSQFSGGAEELYTKIMGRQRDGWSPIPSTLPNAFDYANDPSGERCPLASHVRRANPRTPPGMTVHGLPLRGPRLVRRGFSYGPLSGSRTSGARGLMFMAYNASLAEQFEVIQRWLNGANSTGVLSAHADPLVSHRKNQVITLLDGREPRHLLKRKPFVKLMWGHYFFAPSREVLHQLARRADDDARAASTKVRADQGKAIILKLVGLAGAEAALEAAAAAAGLPPKGPPLSKTIFQWQLLLEDRASRDEARAVWTAIREYFGGVLRTPYGVLAATAPRVLDVMGDEKRFSVREYGRRMEPTVGMLYLGIDRCPVKTTPAEASRCPAHASRDESSAVLANASPAAPDYAVAASRPNDYMARLSRQEGFERACEATRSHFQDLLPYVDVTELAKRVVTDVSRYWFGLPRDRDGYDIHHTAALSIFYPRPAAEVKKAAEALAQAHLPAAKQAALADAPPLAQGLVGLSDEAIATALVGGAQGTLAATVGSFLSVAGQLIENDRLGRIAHWLHSDEGQKWKNGVKQWPAPGVVEKEPDIVREVLRAMGEQPAPDLLHREVVVATHLGHVPLVPGDRVVVSVGSAIAGGLDPNQHRDLLFGGSYPSTGGAPKHPCPGREAALGVILGMLVTLVEFDVRREGPLRVSPRR